MSVSEVVHKSLELPGYWRVTSFGKLAENPRSAGPDLRIHTYVAPILDTTYPHYGAIASEPKFMLLPVGEIPRVHMNAVLLDGKLQSHKIWRLEHEYIDEKRINCSRSNITVIGRFHQDDQGELVIPRTRWTVDDPERHGYYIAFGDKDDPFATIIPAIEIFRFFYATSDVLAKALLRDHFIDPDTNLWSKAKSARSEDGRAVLWLRKNMLDADARFLARFAFDAYAMHQAQQIFLRAAKRGAENGERMLNVLPPFAGTVGMKFYYIPLHNKGRQLITRITQCDWVPPFSDLKWDRDNDGRYDPDNREERPPADFPVGLINVADHPDRTPQNLSVAPPSGRDILSRLKEDEIRQRFPELFKVQAKKLPQESAKTRAVMRNWEAIFKDAYEGSVVEGKSSDDLIGKTCIEAAEKNLADYSELTDAIDSSAGEDSYLVILILLLAIRDFVLAEVEILAVLESTTLVNGTVFNVFPRHVGKYDGAWLYVDTENRNRRMALVAKIQAENKVRYVIELQQRLDQGCSTLVVWNPTETDIPESTLALVLLSCATSTGAKPTKEASLGLCWGRLEHTTKGDDMDSAQHYLNRIFTTKNRSANCGGIP